MRTKKVESTNVQYMQEAPAIAKLPVSSSCLTWFNRIVEINQNNGWVNPVFQPNSTEKFKDEFFTIKVDDYLEIESNYEIDIFRVSKRWGEIIIYCRVVFN